MVLEVPVSEPRGRPEQREIHGDDVQLVEACPDGEPGLGRPTNRRLKSKISVRDVAVMCAAIRSPRWASQMALASATHGVRSRSASRTTFVSSRTRIIRVSSGVPPR
jgi:hypothetical protein